MILPAGFEVDVVVLLVGEAQPTALTEAGRLPGVTAHVGHQQQGRTEALPALRAPQHPLVGTGVLLQLVLGVEPLAALQTADLVRFLVGLLIAPAASVLFVPLEVLLAGKLSEARHAVDALRLALVLPVQLGQPEVAAAAYAGVRQQAEVREAVFEQSIPPAERLPTVRALKRVKAPLLPVPRQGLLGAEAAAARLAHDVHHALVQLHVVLALLQRGEHAFAQVALVKLLLEVCPGQVLPEVVLRGEAGQTDAAPVALHLGLGVRAQVEPVVEDLTEALPAFGAAVWTRTRVQVHVVLELKFGGQLEVTDAAAVLAGVTLLWGGGTAKRK